MQNEDLFWLMWSEEIWSLCKVLCSVLILCLANEEEFSRQHATTAGVESSSYLCRAIRASVDVESEFSTLRCQFSQCSLSKFDNQFVRSVTLNLQDLKALVDLILLSNLKHSLTLNLRVFKKFVARSQRWICSLISILWISNFSFSSLLLRVIKLWSVHHSRSGWITWQKYQALEAKTRT